MGRDNPGCHLLVNNQLHQELASSPELENLPEYQRGPITNYFNSGPVYATNFDLCDTKTQIHINVCVKWNCKNRILSISVNDEESNLRRNIKWEKLVRGCEIPLSIPNLKLKAMLAPTKDQFQLYINGEDI